MGPRRGTIDFFAAQASARRRTALLVLWFALAWLGTVALVHLALVLALGSGLYPALVPLARSRELAAWVAAGVTAVTVLGSAWHGARLAAGGGASVATMLGGVVVDRLTAEAGEKRLVNVVEEMAIAAGLPVPAIYVLPDATINAFAAGFSADRAVVAVTRGAIDELSRDELQGVVAHELSHVLNADTRLNLQLIALVGGLTVLALVGRTLLRRNALGGGLGRRSRGAGSLRLGLVLAGLALWAAGSIGAFFGRLIRLAVSRQRELLADAAAAQFTRNPEALAGALARIAARGSALASPRAPEAAHLLFANGLVSGFLATHPPVEERIRRLLPQPLARARVTAAAAAPPAASGSTDPRWGAGSSGSFGPEHVSHARRVLDALPADIAAAARQPAGASTLVCALLADRESSVREVQLGTAGGDEVRRAELRRIAAALASVAREDRLAVLELALPALDALAPVDARALVAELAAVAAADGRTTILEWAVQRIVLRRLAPQLGSRRVSSPRARTVDDVAVECHELLSVVAWLGARDPAAVQAALDAGARALGVAGRWRPLPRERVTAARMDAALARLDACVPLLKARIVAACAACALADGSLGAAESEVVRAIAASLGCALPSLLPPQAAPRSTQAATQAGPGVISA